MVDCAARDGTNSEGDSHGSVHVCPNCAQVINLEELDVKAIMTRINTCPAGQIELQVVDQVHRKKPT
jgi:hypothetical protein